MDKFNLAAHVLYGKPADWQWCKLDAHNMPPDYFLAQGAVPIGFKTRGPNKGQPKWPATLDTIWMRFSEVRELMRKWEQEHGKCFHCEGSATMSNGKACISCGGTGQPKTTESVRA